MSSTLIPTPPPHLVTPPHTILVHYRIDDDALSHDEDGADYYVVHFERHPGCPVLALHIRKSTAARGFQKESGVLSGPWWKSHLKPTAWGRFQACHRHSSRPGSRNSSHPPHTILLHCRIEDDSLSYAGDGVDYYVVRFERQPGYPVLALDVQEQVAQDWDGRCPVLALDVQEQVAQDWDGRKLDIKLYLPTPPPAANDTTATTHLSYDQPALAMDHTVPPTSAERPLLIKIAPNEVEPRSDKRVDFEVLRCKRQPGYPLSALDLRAKLAKV
ncbi:hypothetical protein BDK51DRAFT_28177 [Blyttiomyces helicus]|uniref:Uncharacterized protein n=1 Tax=Blyttiomyces helicus TaxID=388810 RepID=A0A4V1IRF1_9FUNG|nr:hypothetical protein BDK51DRAFT_28177 [Blyttiomyces helicus]|eukprot:RKO89837.1 hypothetical protein BDK51DRAFT_28177 [Blyttiomyces helicus]